MLLSKDSQLFHSIASIASDKDYRNINKSIIINDFCSTVRLCHWLGIEVIEAEIVKEKMRDYSPYFDYHIKSFEDFLADMEEAYSMLESIDCKPLLNPKEEWTVKLNKAKRLLATVGD
jgi:hypothetical protein